MKSEEKLALRVTRLEELLAHHEYTVEQLNGVIVELRDRFDGLTKTIKSQHDKIVWLESSAGSDHDPNEKPPHY